MDLSLVIPAYKVADKSNSALLEKISVLDSLHIDYEVIYVLDGPDKRLQERIQKLKNNKIRIFALEKNMGKGYAVRYGMAKSNGRYVGFTDADKDIDASSIKTAYECLVKSDADGVIPSKFHKDSIIKFNFRRKLFSKIYNLVIKILFNIGISDTQVGLKIYKNELTQKVIPNCSVNRFAFEIEFAVLAKKYGFNNLVECPVKVNTREYSTIKFKDGFDAIKDTLRIWLRKR